MPEAQFHNLMKHLENLSWRLTRFFNPTAILALEDGNTTDC